MPAAADTKFCTVKPEHLGEVAHRLTSPEYHCQFVLVTKLIAALNDPIGTTLERSVGLNGSEPCSRCSSVEDQHRHDAERDQAIRVHVPALLALRVDAEQRGR